MEHSILAPLVGAGIFLILQLILLFIKFHRRRRIRRNIEILNRDIQSHYPHLSSLFSTPRTPPPKKVSKGHLLTNIFKDIQPTLVNKQKTVKTVKKKRKNL